MILERAIPKFSLTFDRDACLTQGAKINHCMIYCSAKPSQYTHFIVRALIEEWLQTAREPFVQARPNLNMRFEYVSQVERDALFHNGYSILHHRPGFGPILQWGYPSDVSLTDLMGMATVIKTFMHHYETELKFTIAKTLQSVHPVDDLFELQRCRVLVHELFRQVSNAARDQRIAYGRGDLYAPPAHTSEDEYFHMVWQFMSSRAYNIRVDFENFELKFTVPDKLFDLFDSCFGRELTYLMVPQGE